MEPYSNHQPTSFDRKGAFLCDQQDWLVLDVSQNRDSGPLERSNFESALKLLGGESETVEVHRFGHWACGWYEIIIVAPKSKAATIGRNIEKRLEDYPILDEEHFSSLEWEEKHEYWKACDIKERVELCKQAGAPILAARHDDSIPERVDMYIEV